MPQTIFLTRSYTLPALHQLGIEAVSMNENLRIFGPCSRLHGHDYRVEVTVSGPVDRVSGMIISRDQLDRIVGEQVIDPYTGRNLSDYFSHTTGEALALEFYSLLGPCFSHPLRLVSVTLHETAKNSFVAGD